MFLHSHSQNDDDPKGCDEIGLMRDKAMLTLENVGPLPTIWPHPINNICIIVQRNQE